MGCVADGTHEADRRVALLEFTNPAQRRSRYPCRLRSRTRTSSIRGSRLAILPHGRWGRMGTSFSLETTMGRSRTAGRSYPRARRGSTRAHRGKCMALWVSIFSDRRCLGRCHCMRMGRRRFGWGCPFGSHRRGFACKMDRTRLRRVSRLGGRR
jgi:hypothetical protein